MKILVKILFYLAVMIVGGLSGRFLGDWSVRLLGE